MKDILQKRKIETAYKTQMAVSGILLISAMLAVQNSLYEGPAKLSLMLIVTSLFVFLIVSSYIVKQVVKSDQFLGIYYSASALIMSLVILFATRDKSIIILVIVSGPVFLTVFTNFSMRYNILATASYTGMTLYHLIANPIMTIELGRGFYIVVIGSLVAMLATMKYGNDLFWTYNEALKDKIQVAEDRNRELYTTLADLEASEQTIEDQYQEILNLNRENQHVIDQLKAIVKTLDNGIIDIDRHRQSLKMTDQAVTLLGEPASDPKHLFEIFSKYLNPKDAVALHHLWETLSFKNTSQQTLATRELAYTRDGITRYFVIKGLNYDSFHPDENQAILEQHIVLMVKDVTDEYTQAQHIYNMAYTDSLTGLSNRAWFLERAHEVMNLHGLDRVGVMVFDIDNFKYINDTFGFNLGDQLLQSVAKPLKSCYEGTQTCPAVFMAVSRFDGDTFGLLLAGNRADTEYKAIYHWLTQLVRKQELDGSHIHITLSAGVAESEDPNFALTAAEIAMYKAKEKGRASIFTFDEGYLDEVKRHHFLSTALESVLRTTTSLDTPFVKKPLQLHYQPLFKIGKKDPVAYEALARWHHPELGPVAPDEFIAVAEKSGQILALGQWVMHEAMRFSKAHDFQVHINVSPMQLLQTENFAGQFLKALDSYQLSRDRIGIEITEGVLLQDRVQALNQLTVLHEAGVPIALDDFGSGFSSLSYLMDLPITTLKIDKSFIRPLNPTAQRERAIVGTIIQLATQLGLETVAEGVETQDQLDCLATLGCHRVQGYYYCKPIPESDIIKQYAKS